MPGQRCPRRSFAAGFQRVRSYFASIHESSARSSNRGGKRPRVIEISGMSHKEHVVRMSTAASQAPSRPGLPPLPTCPTMNGQMKFGTAIPGDRCGSKRPTVARAWRPDRDSGKGMAAASEFLFKFTLDSYIRGGRCENGAGAR